MDAEAGILGCILTEPERCLADTIVALKPGPMAFYHLPHRQIFETMLELFDDGSAIDTVTLCERLKLWEKLDECGGMSYIVQLANNVPSTQNLSDYINLVLNKFLLRRVIVLCIETTTGAYKVNGQAEDFLSKFEQDVMGVRASTESASAFVDVKDTIQQLQADYEEAIQRNTPSGIQTGYPDIDRLNGGLMAQELIIVAGLRSTGKTSLALNIALNVAKSGICVGIISLETSGKKLMHRISCFSAEVSGGALMRGHATREEIQKVTTAFSRINALSDKLLVSERGDITLAELGAIVRRMHQRGARLFIIDYLQLMQCPGRSEYEKITAGSRFAKNLCKSIDAPLILISSLNRESERGQKQPRAPRLSDLRASGQIEYDADKAWLLYDPQFRDDFSNERQRTVRLNFAKNKDGPTGELDLVFFPQQFRFGSASRSDDEPEFPDVARTPYVG